MNKGGVKMSFTIKCDKCGGEQVFTNYSERWEQYIEIAIGTSTRYGEVINSSIDIYCENQECPNKIEIKL